ncbi:hypothetical protein B0H17DRAFT_1133061 [Mycena rosella]|uniref:Zn(2)-C6 fungal-type domain-containing protein n=1 Tax=Mycena rosella TaxID=1033263 RepID=A0AAD7DIR8_MYCRO|nr:hypothetical protein B0H17DRAFT_1133061 [Mycena rosella]
MSIPDLPVHNPGYLSPFTVKARRTPMACSNCRTAKIKCNPPSEMSTAPCERCTSKALSCHYFPVHEQQDFSPRVNPKKGRDSPPALPYTPPPPFNSMPRYARQPLPDLSLTNPAHPNPAAPISNMGGTEPRYASPYIGQQHSSRDDRYGRHPSFAPSSSITPGYSGHADRVHQYPFDSAGPANALPPSQIAVYPSDYSQPQFFDPSFNGYTQGPTHP